MAIGGLEAAIVTKWNGGGLSSSVTGGIWNEEAKPSNAFPFAAFVVTGSAPKNWTSSSEVRQQGFQIAVYWKENGTDDPVVAVQALLDAIDAVYKTGLTMANADSVISVRRTRDHIGKDPHTHRVWKGELDYQLLRVSAL